MVALGFAGTLLGIGVVASAASPDELKAKAKTVEQPNDAIQVSRQLRRAGLAGDAVQLMGRAKGKAKDNDTLAAVHLELSRAYIDQRQQKKALRGCDPIKKLSEFTEQLCIAEAELLNRRGSTALPASERAMELKPGDYDAMVAKGRALTILGKPTEAEAALKNASRAQSGRPEAFLYTGELLVVQGRVADAITSLREARRADPDFPEVLLLLGQTLPAGKEAREALERAISIRPTFTEARARLGVVLSILGEYDQAEKMLQEALKAQPRQADWHAALGDVALKKKKPDQALKSAHDALKIVGNHGPARLVEAKALAEKGEIDLAISAFEAAYGLMRTDPIPLVDAARACVKGARLTTAKAFADRATDDFGKSSLAWEAAGDVAVASKDLVAARSAYTKAIAGDGSADRDAIKRKLAALK
jgi:tetratricopeptide (TPR) repeat protein